MDGKTGYKKEFTAEMGNLHLNTSETKLQPPSSADTEQEKRSPSPIRRKPIQRPQLDRGPPSYESQHSLPPPYPGPPPGRTPSPSSSGPAGQSPSDGLFNANFPLTPLEEGDPLEHVVVSGEANNVAPEDGKGKSKIQSTMEDASIWLGGLIKHPTESTRHFTIMRHSHGLVYYKGPSTSIAITIFADKPIPPDRRLWMQMRGHSGDTGMALKGLLRSNSDWINVTPDRQIAADELIPLDERAWQRDIKKFREKASKAQRNHTERETVVIRVPFEATDGYFRLVLSKRDNKSILCPSPVFRVASMSMSASSVKGASVTTLPLELALQAAQFAATRAAMTAAGPAALAAQSRVGKHVPIAKVTAKATKYAGYAQTAYDRSGAAISVVAPGEEQFAIRQQEFLMRLREASNGSQVIYEPVPRPDFLGSDLGPETPFPFRLKGQVTKGSNRSTNAIGIPTANLDDLPTDEIGPIKTGVYMGWAQVIPKQKKNKDETEPDLHNEWLPAIISVIHEHGQKAGVAQRKGVRVYISHSYPPNTLFYEAKLKLILMGYLRPLLPLPADPATQEAFLAELVRDTQITQASLARENWEPEGHLNSLRNAQSERSVTDRYVDARTVGQRQWDKIPMHKLGVRVDGAGAHDRGMYGNGGVWVKRDG